MCLYRDERKVWKLSMAEMGAKWWDPRSVVRKG